MFRVVVVAGVSLAACGGEETEPRAPVTTNPPAPLDAGSDGAVADASDADAQAADAMPIIL